MRDFYDLYSLYCFRKDEIDFSILKQAVISTGEKRKSISLLNEAKEIIKDIREDSYLQELWKVYLQDNSYIENLDYFDVVKVIEVISEQITIEEI